MYVRITGGEICPRTWQEFEGLIVRSTEHPNVVIALRPGAWQEYERQFLRGTEGLDEDFEIEEMLDGIGYEGAKFSCG